VPRRKDIWRCGVALQTVEQLLTRGWDAAPVIWLPEQPRFSFLADPFAWQQAGVTHLFVERYDYLARHGVIDRLTLDSDWRVVESRCVLQESWHLSYPCVFSGEGAVWMLPEAHRSQGLTLYRGSADLSQWSPEVRIELDSVPVDATPLWHADRWWLFYSPATNWHSKIAHLHVASAPRLAGPWTSHPRNPVHVSRASSRPGGTPVLINGRIMIPMQDCTHTYGGAIRPLWITRLDVAGFSAEVGEALPIPPSAGKYDEGLHTLSGCGAATFLDVKRIDRSAAGLWLEVRRAWRRRGP
jgi:hypothetical protein